MLNFAEQIADALDILKFDGILELLLEHPKQVFSKEEIFEYAWDEH